MSGTNLDFSHTYKLKKVTNPIFLKIIEKYCDYFLIDYIENIFEEIKYKSTNLCNYFNLWNCSEFEENGLYIQFKLSYCEFHTETELVQKGYREYDSDRLGYTDYDDTYEEETISDGSGGEIKIKISLFEKKYTNEFEDISYKKTFNEDGDQRGWHYDPPDFLIFVWNDKKKTWVSIKPRQQEP